MIRRALCAVVVVTVACPKYGYIGSIGCSGSTQFTVILMPQCLSAQCVQMVYIVWKQDLTLVRAAPSNLSAGG